AERVDAGRAVRAATPRRSLAELADRDAGYDPVTRVLAHGEGRVAPLLALRHARMLASPFAFLRGSALLMSDDLVAGASTSLAVTLCGDAHCANFGVFQSPERREVFDVNDFDETTQGPFEFDLKRLAASLAVVADGAGLTDADQRDVAATAASAYQSSIARFARATRLDVWFAALDLDDGLAELRGFFADDATRNADDVVRRARDHDARSFAALVTRADGEPCLRLAPPRVTGLSDGSDGTLTRAQVESVMTGWRSTLSSDRRVLAAQFDLVDAAHLVRGVGSVGTECFAALFTGRDRDDVLVLQVKEALRPVLGVARGVRGAKDEGLRVVSGQRLMQATPDDLLGWHSLEVAGRRRSFYVRQLYDGRAAVDVERLGLSSLRAYARVCAWALARAHARSGLSAEIAGYVGEGRQFARCVADFALAYRDRNAEDFALFTDAARQGRVSVES
ncbi:MAG: DUF2252 domain-containing protein, partial [Acidimicrobiales bacterium]